MAHPIHRVVNFEIVAPYTLRVEFDDGAAQAIDFRPVLVGEMYGPLRDARLFNQVEIDPEVHTLVWPNGADFDPATLHAWPKYASEMKRIGRRCHLTIAGVGVAPTWTRFASCQRTRLLFAVFSL